jgi:hypothetical protein
MEEAFVLLASLVRKRDAAHQNERERLQQVASKYKYEINSLKMQLKHFKGFYQRGNGGVRSGGAMPRTRSVEAMQMRCGGGDESDEEYDDYGAGHDAADMWRTRDGEDDVTTIFNRLKSKLRKERAADRDYLHQPHDADEEYDRSNQELLWALKEVQVCRCCFLLRLRTATDRLVLPDCMVNRPRWSACRRATGCSRWSWRRREVSLRRSTPCTKTYPSSSR